MSRFISWYLGKLHHAAHHDAELSIVFLKVANLLEPPPSVLRPGVVWRVLRGNLWPRRGTLPADPATTIPARSPTR